MAGLPSAVRRHGSIIPSSTCAFHGSSRIWRAPALMAASPASSPHRQAHARAAPHPRRLRNPLAHRPAALPSVRNVEERYRRKSTLITAQVPVARWHDLIADPTVADAILDRIVHNAHRITLQGDSMRKQKAPPLLTGDEHGEINHP